MCPLLDKYSIHPCPAALSIVFLMLYLFLYLSCYLHLMESSLRPESVPVHDSDWPLVLSGWYVINVYHLIE